MSENEETSSSERVKADEFILKKGKSGKYQRRIGRERHNR